MGLLNQEPREATLADLEGYAHELRQAGYVGPLYLYGGGPGIIRQSRREPPGVGRYVVLGEKGRIWTITDGG